MTIAEAELRGIVREVLSDALPTLRQSAEVRQVRISSDTDLTAFVNEILALAADKTTGARLRSGLLRFTLDGAPAAVAAPAVSRTTAAPQSTSAPAAPAQAAIASVLRIEKGAVTERVIAQAAQSGSRLVLGPRAILTPLAREGARKHRVVIERAS